MSCESVLAATQFRDAVVLLLTSKSAAPLLIAGLLIANTSAHAPAPWDRYNLINENALVGLEFQPLANSREFFRLAASDALTWAFDASTLHIEWRPDYCARRCPFAHEWMKSPR
jgi:hypothetical protein